MSAARVVTPARLGAIALLVVVLRHATITDGILGAALATIALVASMFVPARLPLTPFWQRAGTALVGASGGVLAWLETPEIRSAGLTRGWATLSLVALFAAAFRTWLHAPRGGFFTTFVVALVSLVACGETIFGGGYPAFVIAYLLLGLTALRAHDEPRTPLATLPRRTWIATGTLLALATLVAVGLSIALPPFALKVRDRLVTTLGDPRTGLGDRMLLGSLEGMLVSDEIIARVHGPPTDYLRGVVYDHYQAGQWATSTTDGTRILPGNGAGAPDAPGLSAGSAGPAASAASAAPSSPRVRVVLVNPQRGDRYPVPLGARAITTPDGNLAVDRFGAFRPERGIPTEISFDLAVPPDQPDYPPIRPATDDLRMPLKLSESIGPLLKTWIEGKTTPEDRVAAIQHHLLTNYKYSLEYTRGPGDPLRNFLQENPQGHCEYFASAMVMLTRRAGIPARVVAGYRVAERNELGGYGIIRERNAHAWVEVYFAGKGWVTYDPTPEDLLPQNQAHQTPLLAALLDLAGAWWGDARARLLALSLWQVIGFLGAFIVVALVVRWWGRRVRRERVELEAFFRADAPPAALGRLLAALAKVGYR